MKPPQVTKEQLAIELAQTKQARDLLATSDERRRKEFAKAFNWVKNARYDTFGIHIEKEPQLPSWEQIFVQLGRLLMTEELKQELKEKIVSSFPMMLPPENEK